MSGVYGTDRALFLSAFTASTSAGTPYVQVWIAIALASCSTSLISSFVAPWSSASRICRRMPGAYSNEGEAQIASPINALTFSGSGPAVHDASP